MDVTSRPSALATYLNSVGGHITPKQLVERTLELSSTDESQRSDLVGLSNDVLMTALSNVSRAIRQHVALQTFLAVQMRSLARHNDVVLFLKVLKSLDGDIGIESAKMSSKLTTSKTADQRETMEHIIVDMCLHWDNGLLAASTVLKHHYPEVIVKRVLDYLLLKDPKNDEIALDLIMKITSKYNWKFDVYHTSQIQQKILALYTNKSVLSKLTRFFSNHIKASNNDFEVRSTYELILNDASIHNRAGMYRNWRRISQVYSNIMDYDLQVVSIMIKEFLKSKGYQKLAQDLIQRIPHEHYTHPFLVDSIMRYAILQNDIDMINDIVENLETPVPRPVLSTLLKMNMKLGDYQGLERIMSQISHSGMESKDYAIIVDGLLQKGDLMDAISFTHGIPQQLSHSAYLRIVNHLVSTKGQFHERELVIVQDIVDKCRSMFELTHPFWTMLSSLYIRYLTKTFGYAGVWKSKMIYERSTQDFLLDAYSRLGLKSPVMSTDICRNPWGVQEQQHLIRLSIGLQSRIIVVKTIFDKARKHNMREVMDWALLELVELGMSPEDLRIDITRCYNRDAAQVGFRESDSEQQFKRIWTKGCDYSVKECEPLQKYERTMCGN